MLNPFTQLFQHCWGHACSLRMVYKDLWVVSFPQCTVGPNIVGSCCIRLHTTANTDATTPNIVGATMLGVVASVCTQPNNLVNGEPQRNWRWNFRTVVAKALLPFPVPESLLACYKTESHNQHENERAHANSRHVLNNSCWFRAGDVFSFFPPLIPVYYNLMEAK